MLLALLLACFTDGDPCIAYCDYVCDCHAGEEGFDCAGCYDLYQDAGADLQDACEADLQQLRAEDQAAEHECVAAGDDTAA